MFIGHYGLALAAKRAAPKTSLGTLVLATQFADCLWPIFLILGWEHVEIAPGNTRMTPLDFVSYPWSHSLLMDALWAAAFAGIYFALRRYAAGAWMVALGVISHWVLDWISHRPDMPLSPWSSHKVGLGLWNSMAGTLIVEVTLFGGGLALYLSSTRAKDRVGKIALWSLIGLLAFGWAGNLFSPPPTSVQQIQYSAPLLWLTPLWAWWADRHRSYIAAP